MEILPKDRILEFHPDTLGAVRKMYGLDKSDEMCKSIDILEDWMRKQDHFIKKDFPRDYLERTIITTKGSVERAKERLDKGCTIKGLLPHFFEDYDMRVDYKEFQGVITHAILPKPTKDHYRVFILRNVGSKFESTIIVNYFRSLILFGEYLRAHDYINGYIMLLDYRSVNLLELATKINIVDLRQAISILIEAYGTRLKGIHILSSSKLVEMVVTVFKQVLSAKLGGRIQVHKSMESLHEFIPTDVLPVEYGGKERSLETLHDEWVDVLSSKEQREYQRGMNRARTDESLRRVDTFNDQYLGMPGTFRTFSVD